MSVFDRHPAELVPPYYAHASLYCFQVSRLEISCGRAPLVVVPPRCALRVREFFSAQFVPNMGLTPVEATPSFKTTNSFMAENIPNVPAGAVPPKKETGKVQPKKETVRINLPPKPSAAPTIKLPTLPPGGPAGGTAPAPTFGAKPAAAPAAAPSAAAPRATAAPASKPGAAAAPAAAPRRAPAAAPSAARLSPVDTILAIAAAVLGLIAVGSTAYLGWLL